MRKKLALGTSLLLTCLVTGLMAQDPKALAPTASRKPSTSSASSSTSSLPDIGKVTAGADKLDGIFTLYRKKGRLYLEIRPNQLDKPYLFVSAISRGIGSRFLYGGMTMEDWLLCFRRVEDRIHIVHKNVRFRARRGSPAAEAVKQAYSDSILASLRIVGSRGSRGNVLVDFTDFLMADLLNLSGYLGAYRFDRSRSTLGKVKNFPLNAEIEINATYAGSARGELETVPDPRSVSVTIHYSLCALPETGYRPRLADDRVGYFVTAVKDYSRPPTESAFVRYINRWHLEKADPRAEKSPPKKPIIFYIEKTVPYQYRRDIREGILEWNKAFEKIGFLDAIEVRTQPADADWDPEDVRYTTFRWMTSSAGFAMGPSRVNPLTGQIFDADIIFDADFIRSWQTTYDIYQEETSLPRGWDDRVPLRCGCCSLMRGRGRDIAFGTTALLVRGLIPPGKVPEELIHQGLKEVVMHEVGHTLGLRHNFKASTLWSLDELHDVAKTRAKGVTASVMDYAPVNIAPKGVPQGDYFSTTIGPYDYWAIEYGYKPIAASSPEGELKELRKIASRSTEPELTYATDEDTDSFDPDPYSNRFDLGKDPLAYAKRQTEIIDELWRGKLIERVVPEGRGYQRARRIFDLLMRQYRSALYLASRYIGGVDVHRNHKGDPNERPPMRVVSPAKQKEALAFLNQRAFSDKAFQFDPKLLNHLTPERWLHWGMRDRQVDYPVHVAVLNLQKRILNRLFDAQVLARVLDNERRCTDDDCLTLPDIFRQCTEAIWSEAFHPPRDKASNRHPAISSYRRALQREHLRKMISLVLRPGTGMPEDARTQAWATLRYLQKQIQAALDKDSVWDDYSRAHLEESQARIRKALDAAFQQSG